jgi:nucleoside-diphosphate-sugar epimerase
MAYTLQQIYEALGKIENGGPMVADLQNAIGTIRGEAASNRTSRNKVLDALGLRDGDNVDDSVKNLAATLTALRQVGNPEELGTQLSTLQQQVKDLTDKYDASEKKVADEKAARIQADIKSKLVSALTENKAVKPDIFAGMLAGNIVAKDDDSMVYKDGDKEVSIVDGVKNWLSANAWAVKNDSINGAGSGSGGGNTGDGKKYTMDDLKNMSRDEINKHWNDISKGISEGENK